jgi:hydrogenase nickel incorporation protein HypB
MTRSGRLVRVPLAERVLESNDRVASGNRQALEARGILAVNLIGAPGSGKTALLEATLRLMRVHGRPAVLVGDLTTRRDGDRLARWCDQVIQISTGQGCHLEAGQVRDALGQLDLDSIDTLFIENVGNLICPVGFDLGEAVTVGLFSLTEGDDKAAKHPYLVQAADLILLNKSDLQPHLSFDRAGFEADVRLLNPTVAVLDVSATTGRGLEAWAGWLNERRPAGAGRENR